MIDYLKSITNEEHKNYTNKFKKNYKDYLNYKGNSILKAYDIIKLRNLNNEYKKLHNINLVKNYALQLIDKNEQIFIKRIVSRFLNEIELLDNCKEEIVREDDKEYANFIDNNTLISAQIDEKYSKESINKVILIHNEIKKLELDKIKFNYGLFPLFQNDYESENLSYLFEVKLVPEGDFNSEQEEKIKDLLEKKGWFFLGTGNTSSGKKYYRFMITKSVLENLKIKWIQSKSKLFKIKKSETGSLNPNNLFNKALDYQTKFLKIQYDQRLEANPFKILIEFPWWIPNEIIDNDYNTKYSDIKFYNNNIKFIRLEKYDYKEYFESWFDFKENDYLIFKLEEVRKIKGYVNFMLLQNLSSSALNQGDNIWLGADHCNQKSESMIYRLVPYVIRGDEEIRIMDKYNNINCKNLINSNYCINSNNLKNCRNLNKSSNCINSDFGYNNHFVNNSVYCSNSFYINGCSNCFNLFACNDCDSSNNLDLCNNVSNSNYLYLSNDLDSINFGYGLDPRTGWREQFIFVDSLDEDNLNEALKKLDSLDESIISEKLYKKYLEKIKNYLNLPNLTLEEQFDKYLKNLKRIKETVELNEDLDWELNYNIVNLSDEVTREQILNPTKLERVNTEETEEYESNQFSVLQPPDLDNLTLEDRENLDDFFSESNINDSENRMPVPELESIESEESEESEESSHSGYMYYGR